MQYNKFNLSLFAHNHFRDFQKHMNDTDSEFKLLRSAQRHEGVEDLNAALIFQNSTGKGQGRQQTGKND